MSLSLQLPVSPWVNKMNNKHLIPTTVVHVTYLAYLIKCRCIRYPLSMDVCMTHLTYLIKSNEKEYVLRKPPHGAKIKSGHRLVNLSTTNDMPFGENCMDLY